MKVFSQKIYTNQFIYNIQVHEMSKCKYIQYKKIYTTRNYYWNNFFSKKENNLIIISHIASTYMIQIEQIRNYVVV